MVEVDAIADNLLSPILCVIYLSMIFKNTYNSRLRIRRSGVRIFCGTSF